MQPIRSILLSTAVSVSLLACATAAAAQQSASSSGTMPTLANDTAINKRDRSSQTMKPTDQPEDKADIKLAAAVRRSIYKDKSLSTSAHNVKMVAAQGVVTLRGPIKNADEKAKVEADAKAVSGVSSVDNQLDVKN